MDEYGNLNENDPNDWPEDSVLGLNEEEFEEKFVGWNYVPETERGVKTYETNTWIKK